MPNIDPKLQNLEKHSYQSIFHYVNISTILNLGILPSLPQQVSNSHARPGRGQSASAAKRWEGATAQQRATGTALAGAQGWGHVLPEHFGCSKFAIPHIAINFIWAKRVNGLLQLMVDNSRGILETFWHRKMRSCWESSCLLGITMEGR